MENKQSTEKKMWEKPELTVLTRNKPEEAVLTGCKDVPGAGPSNTNASCKSTTSGGCAYGCAIISAS